MDERHNSAEFDNVLSCEIDKQNYSNTQALQVIHLVKLLPIAF